MKMLYEALTTLALFQLKNQTFVAEEKRLNVLLIKRKEGEGLHMIF